MPGKIWYGAGSGCPRDPQMDPPGIIHLHKVQPLPKIFLILSKGAPIRTIPKVCTFRPHKFSHHYQVLI